MDRKTLNLKKTMLLSIMTVPILYIASCKTAQISRLNDFSFLNGEWIQPCDSLLTGEYKDEIECTIMDEDATRYVFDISGSQGLLVRKLPRSNDTTLVAFKYNEDNQLILENKSKKEAWRRKVYHVDSVKLKLYSKNNSAIEFFERRD
ncbi:hypothetical protein ACOKFD_08845 [Flagellimonas sp. S174]|uniref:hypothetical protein n=1 Tax=Flagellimonas sp. S174 TaxID=3410790 RepID=UPI003BF4B591